MLFKQSVTIFICFRYIIGILDVAAVQGEFNVYKDSVFANSAIAFPVVSIISGIILFLIGACAIESRVSKK